MSAQCWCFFCAGKIVTRKTYQIHGRKQKPDAPLADPALPVLSMPDCKDELAMGDDGAEVNIEDNASDSDHDPLELDGDEHKDAPCVGEAQLTRPEITLLFLDWMCKHKLPDSAAADMWRLMGLMMPPGVTFPEFAMLKRILGKAESSYVRRLDLCPNDCIVYYDSQHLKEPYRHAHRFNCPVCGHPRYVEDPVDRALRPAKTLFWFPVAPYVRSLFARRDLIPHLLHDSDQGTEGSLLRSRGFQTKVRDNPYMNNDHRNLGLVGTTDGVPFFEDQRRGAWPFVLRCANLPDALSMHIANCHLHLLSANEFWELDEDAGVLRRRIRAPKSLKPHLIVAVDDLLGAYNGVPCKDATAMPGSQQHRFMCRTLLLYWTGDYPAVSAVSGTHSKSCHWCCKKSSAAPEVQRRVWDGYRKYLPAGHVLRNASAFNGSMENDPPPLARTHAEFVQGGRANEVHMAQLGLPGARKEGIFKNNLPYKQTGIKELSPLANIPLFDMTWDILPDLMHIIPGIWKRHIFALLAGQRQPASVKARKKNTRVQNKDLLERHAACCEEISTWELDQATKDTVDKRTRALAGTPTWIRSNLEVRTP